MSESRATTTPRAGAAVTLALVALGAGALGVPALAVATAALGLVVLGVWWVVLPVHGRWLERWALGASVALIVAAAGDASGSDADVSSLLLCLIADGAAVAFALGWSDAPGLSARAAALAGSDPVRAGWLRRRALILGERRRPARAEDTGPALPADEGALLARLEALAAWEHGAFVPLTPRSRLSTLREVCVDAAGAPLFLAPLAGALLLAAWPARDAWVGAHVVALVAYAWGLCAVGVDRAIQRLDGPAKALLAWGGLVGLALVIAVVGFRVGTQVAGLELDPGAGSAATLRALATRLGRPEGRLLALAVLVGAAVPAALWGVLGRQERTLDPVARDAAPPPRRISSAVAGTPWFLACALVFVVDVVALSAFAGRSLAVVSLFGAGMAATHAFVVALAYGGLRALDRPRQEGLRRTIEDERRRVLTALVQLRAERVAANDSLDPIGDRPGGPIS